MCSIIPTFPDLRILSFLANLISVEIGYNTFARLRHLWPQFGGEFTQPRKSFLADLCASYSYLVRFYQLVIVDLDAVHGDDRSGLDDVLAPLPPLLAADLHDAEDRLDGASPTEHEEVCGVTRWRDRGRVRRGRGVSENTTGMRETPLARL